MSILVVIPTSNGIIIASDSKTESLNPIVKKKFIGLIVDGKNYAVCFVGRAEINGTTVYEIFKSLSETFDTPNPTIDDIINYFANGIREQIEEKFKSVDIKEKKRISIHFLLCGFKDQNIQEPIIYQCVVVGQKSENQNVAISQDIHIKNDSFKFGVFAIGKDSFIEGFLSDKNPNGPMELKDLSSISMNGAVAYAKKLVEIMCDSDSDCGPPIKSAVLTPSGLVEHDDGAK